MKSLLIIFFLFTVAIQAQVDFTIAANDSLSDIIDLNKDRVIAIQAPTLWDAAHISFRASNKKTGTFLPVKKDSVNYLSYEIEANGGIYLIEPAKLAGFRFLQIQSGYGGSMYVRQTAKRVLKAYTWPIKQP